MLAGLVEGAVLIGFFGVRKTTVNQKSLALYAMLEATSQRDLCNILAK